MDEKTDSGLRKAILAAGSQTALADALGITQSAIAQWDKVPVQRVHQVESLTGVSRYELRPDIFGFAPSLATSKAA